MKSFHLVLAAAVLSASAFVQAAVFDVRDYGARGDGVTKDTEAIQKAIEAAADSGGGRVLLRAGVYPSRPLVLKSHVELHLEEGARIVFTTNKAEFASVPAKAARGMGSGFLLAWDAEDIAITGEGTLDGQGGLYFAHRPWRGTNARFFDPVLSRSQMVTFVRCRNVRMRGVTFKDSASWTMRLRLCEDVDLDRIGVINDLRFINADGIDIDGCRHLRLRRSRFLTGDDSVVLRAIPEPGSELKVVTEDVVVDDCDLTSACQCVRLGCPSDDTIRRVVLRNLRLAGFNGICMENPPWYLARDNEGKVDFHDLLIENVSGSLDAHAIRLNTSSGVKIRGFRDVRFRNFNVSDRNGLLIRTNAFSPYERLTFENVVYNGVALPDGACPVKGTDNWEPLTRMKPGEFNYKPPADYVKPVYRTVGKDDGGDLERALAEVAAHGNGVVLVRAGEYESKGLTLGGGVEMRLEKGARIRCDAVVSKGAKDVAITGAGLLAVGEKGVLFADCSCVRLDGVRVEGVTEKPVRLERCRDVEMDSFSGAYDLQECAEVRVGPTVSVRMPETGLCGHQGDCGRYAGNTVRSIESAVELGAEMVEFDVQRCRTGEFVLMHDREIDRLTTGSGRIPDHTLDELKGFRTNRLSEMCKWRSKGRTAAQ